MQQPPTNPAENAVRPRIRRLGLFAALALALTLAGPFLYLLRLDDPALRRTGAVLFSVMGVGCLLGLATAYWDRRFQIRWLAGLNVALAVGIGAMFTFLGKLPHDSGAPQAGQPAPTLTLTDHQGTEVDLAREFAAGPVLLVFYRGFW